MKCNMFENEQHILDRIYTDFNPIPKMKFFRENIMVSGAQYWTNIQICKKIIHYGVRGW